jgi:hypothetical protein
VNVRTRGEIEEAYALIHAQEKTAAALESIAENLEKLVTMIGNLPAPGQGIWKKG